MGKSGSGRRRVTVLGSTGSIGVSTVDLLAAEKDAVEVCALVGGSNAKLLAHQARELEAEWAVINDESQLGHLKALLAGTPTRVAAGRRAVVEAAGEAVDWTMAAITGAAGLEPALAAARNGGVLALANKEALVCAGNLMLGVLKEAGATLLPVDSEHNAIAQSLGNTPMTEVEKLILTASGGPFRQFSLEKMRGVTREMALKHPTWSMGMKITIDSATMANKGLEIIEAAQIFDMPEDRIDVLVHPQSVVHGMVSFCDGSFVAQLGSADMRIPIAHTLAWPKRMHTACPRLDLAALGRLEFEPADEGRFRPLALARRALREKGPFPAVFSAANEVAVEAFLAEKIGFLQIGETIEYALDQIRDKAPPASLEEVFAWDAFGRRKGSEYIEKAAHDA